MPFVRHKYYEIIFSYGVQCLDVIDDDDVWWWELHNKFGECGEAVPFGVKLSGHGNTGPNLGLS